MKRFLIRLLEKQRIFIKPELFINIDKKFINVIYKEHKHFSEIKGHIVAACDSSIFDLPNVTLTRRELLTSFSSFSKKYLSHLKINLFYILNFPHS